MSFVADRYTEPLVELWSQFRDEVLPHLLPDPFSAEEWREMKGPSETLDDLWFRAQSEKLGSRGDKILARLRDWLHGAEQSALEDRDQVEALFERCSQRPELARWRDLAPSQREQIFDQLLRTLSGVSGMILNQKPRTKTGMEFTILWQKDGDGHGHWEAEAPTRAFSLAAATRDLADLHGHFNAAIAAAVTRQILHDLRTRDLVLPLLARSARSTMEQTWLRPISPGNNADQKLALPERIPTDEDEMALQQAAPRLWRVYDEASVLAGKENMEPPILNWDDIDVPAAAEPIEDPGHVTELCIEIKKATPMSMRAVCTVVATPLKVISQRSANPTLQRKAQRSLVALVDLLKR